MWNRRGVFTLSLFLNAQDLRIYYTLVEIQITHELTNSLKLSKKKNSILISKFSETVRGVFRTQASILDGAFSEK